MRVPLTNADVLSHVIGSCLEKIGDATQLSGEQRGFLYGFARGMVVAGGLTAKEAEEMLEPVLGAEYLASHQTIVRLEG